MCKALLAHTGYRVAEYRFCHGEEDKLMIKVGALKQLFDEQMNRHCDELKELQDETQAYAMHNKN